MQSITPDAEAGRRVSNMTLKRNLYFGEIKHEYKKDQTNGLYSCVLRPYMPKE